MNRCHEPRGAIVLYHSPTIKTRSCLINLGETELNSNLNLRCALINSAPNIINETFCETMKLEKRRTKMRCGVRRQPKESTDQLYGLRSTTRRTLTKKSTSQNSQPSRKQNSSFTAFAFKPHNHSTPPRAMLQSWNLTETSVVEMSSTHLSLS
jgi:hypothetical protein